MHSFIMRLGSRPFELRSSMGRQQNFYNCLSALLIYELETLLVGMCLYLQSWRGERTLAVTLNFKDQYKVNCIRVQCQKQMYPVAEDCCRVR